jgi:hypothetical protein
MMKVRQSDALKGQSHKREEGADYKEVFRVFSKDDEG